MLRLFLLLLLCLPLQAQSRLDEIVRRGRLRVGTTGDYPPFTLLSEGNYQGFDIQLAARVAQRLGVRVEYVPTRWGSLLEDLNADRFDLAAGGARWNAPAMLASPDRWPSLANARWCGAARKPDSPAKL